MEIGPPRERIRSASEAPEAFSGRAVGTAATVGAAVAVVVAIAADVAVAEAVAIAAAVDAAADIPIAGAIAVTLDGEEGPDRVDGPIRPRGGRGGRRRVATGRAEKRRREKRRREGAASLPMTSPDEGPPSWMGGAWPSPGRRTDAAEGGTGAVGASATEGEA